jgi:hypothetical protein
VRPSRGYAELDAGATLLAFVSEAFLPPRVLSLLDVDREGDGAPGVDLMPSSWRSPVAAVYQAEPLSGSQAQLKGEPSSRSWQPWHSVLSAC